jgi:hypothetical protein
MDAIAEINHILRFFDASSVRSASAFLIQHEIQLTDLIDAIHRDFCDLRLNLIDSAGERKQACRNRQRQSRTT